MTDLEGITATITTAMNQVYNHAANPDTPAAHNTLLQSCWRRLDAALWCVRQITGQAEDPTPTINAPFPGAHPT